jgi:hypothetical protein
MALGWPPADVFVVGFCGLPVRGAAAIAPPFLRSGKWYFAADPASPVVPTTVVGDDELQEYADAGFVSLTATHWPHAPGGVVLYAHTQFLAPGENRLELPRKSLTESGRDDVVVAYLSRGEALTILEEWGRLLLRDANVLFAGRPSEEALLRAQDSAERALFCAPPPEHRDLRTDAFVSLASAKLLLGQPLTRLYREIGLDFDDLTLARIRQRIEARAAGTYSYPPPAVNAHREDPADGKRLRLVVTRAECL